MRIRTTACGLVMLAFAPAFVRGAQAQQAPASSAPAKASIMVRLTPAQAGVFRDALTALAEQGHTLILAEGAPLHPKLPPKDVPALPQDRPLEEAIRKVAAAYDYDVERDTERRGSIFLLRKRYTDPHDLPCVTFDECARSVQDIIRVMSPFTPDSSPGMSASPRASSTINELEATFYGLINSLTPEQMQALQNKSLRVASLFPNQQALAWRFAMHFYVQIAFGEAQFPTFCFQYLPKAKIGEGTSPPHGSLPSYTFFGWGMPDPRGRPEMLPFSRSLSIRNGQADPRESPPAPNADQKTAFKARLEAIKQDGHVTLTGQVATLSTASHEARGPRLKVDAALAAKPVTVAGEANAAPKEVFYALADLYDLQTVTDDDGALLLTRRAALPPADVAGLSGAVLTAVPDPLLRAVHSGASVILKREADEESRRSLERGQAIEALRTTAAAQAGPEKQRTLDTIRQMESEVRKSFQETEQNWRQRQADGAVPAKLHQAALEWLRSAIPSYPAEVQVDRRVPFSALSETDRAAVATVLMTDFLDSVRGHYSRLMPDYVTRFDEAVFVGGPYVHEDRRGKWKFRLEVDVPNADGSGLMGGPGMSDMTYDPPPGQADPQPANQP